MNKSMGSLPVGIIQGLVEEKLNLASNEFELFGLQHEGKPLPGGYEEESGRILTKDGKVYSFWVTWDSRKTAPGGSKGYYTLGDTVYSIDGVPYFREISIDSYKRLHFNSAYHEAKERLLIKEKKISKGD
jgi:hypothetical protein